MRARGSLVAVVDDRLTIPEVARRLGLPGPDVYQLIFSGQLEGGPDQDGAVHVTSEALATYQRKAGLPVS